MNEALRVLDLFSGIGGFSLGLERAGMRTAAFCEIEPFCQDVLRKHWPNVPIHKDIRKLDGTDYHGRIDLICGGFPCQPYSVAGRKKGTQDDRDLWPEMLRVIQQAKPAWVIGENVANFLSMAFTRTKTDLEAEGYTVQPFILPACAVGAPHERQRCFILAYNRCQRGKRSLSQPVCGESSFSWLKDVRGIEDLRNRPDLPKPLICRTDDGFSRRVDRLRGLGNAVIPEIAEILGKAIVSFNHGTGHAHL